MPTWLSAMIAVTVGLSSGGFAAWLTTRNDRRERFRHRLIEAADEFASAAAAALIKTRDALHAVQASGVGTDAAREQRDALLQRSARVDLLFGPGQDASRRAADVLYELTKVGSLLMSPSPDPNAAVSAHLAAAEALRGFNLAAADAIERAKPPIVSLADRERHDLAKRRRGSWRR